MTTENKSTYLAEDMDAIRDRLSETTSGPEYWRSLEEVAQTDAFKSYVTNEFHVDADSGQALGAVSRRNFLQVMGASLALAGVTSGCARQPNETIHPYVKPPEEFIPGKPTYFASSFVNGGYGHGVLIESHMGRPTKIEGLPSHPASLGRTDAQTQASVLDLYDPDRTKSVQKTGNPASWDSFVAEATAILDNDGPNGGASIRLLTGSITSPLEALKIEQFLAANPNAKWHQYEAFGRDNERAGSQMAFGKYLDTLLHFKKADVVVSLDSDAFEQGPGRVRYTADFAARRAVEDFDKAAHHGEGSEGETHGEGSEGETSEESHGEFHAKQVRTYSFESSPTLLGAMADHRFPFRPSQIEDVARFLADALGVDGALPAGETNLDEKQKAWITTVAADLELNKRSSIITVGSGQSPAVHALGHAINDRLENTGSTVTYIEPVEVNPVDQIESLKSLVADMNTGSISLLLVMGDVNPVYSAPADLEFASALEKVNTRVRLSRYADETGALCHWQLPELHYLEAWGDARSFDGTVSLTQPMIAPLYGGKTRVELLSALVDEAELSGHEMLQASYKAKWNLNDDSTRFDAKWRGALGKGVIEGSASDTTTAPKPGAAGPYTQSEKPEGKNVEVIFMSDPSVGDGSFSNNAWLQEVPNPLTKLTWDNAVLVGYSTAKRLGLENEMEVEVSLGGRKVTGAIWIQPGHASDTITLHGGYGRTKTGKVCEKSKGYLGFNAYSLRASDHTFANHASIKKLNSRYPLARTEEHFNMEGRGLVRHITEEDFTKHPGWVFQGKDHEFHHPKEYETLLKPDEKTKWNKEGKNRHAWAMTIDLNQCTGCNACIIACQSENIIPVVGKDEVRRGREMQWIRLDRYYFSGREHAIPGLGDDASNALDRKTESELDHTLDNPTTYFQPVPCMQCENALCEIVCPVGATMHSREGLNDMVYNRCIGTRYCSNNCPYKVRRYNFFNFTRTPLGSRGDRGWSNQGVKTVMDDGPLEAIKFTPTHINPESLKLMRNPDVTVRTRGVMEKCTYCVQRINAARIEAKKADTVVSDEKEITDSNDLKVIVACEQACPAGAITFGNMLDEHSKVGRNRASARNYAILADLNTKPRTTYLAKITNPNPEIIA
ncbi:TAT-variant-translocated molybdopterin oxidoreductase [bacterium AH-315-P07]|nr:TAT-variant-translocated molybdopterin oxidoreductase [bacterium AH-315-P07]